LALTSENLMIPNLRHLSYVVAVAEHGSIAKAAQAIGVSQPAISAAIKACEDEFGLRLFVRSPARPLSVTSTGWEFVARTRIFLDAARDYHMQSLGLSRAPVGTLNVACLVLIAAYLMPPIIKAMAKSNPGITINLCEGDLDEIIQMVKRGTVEAALTYDLHFDKDVAFEVLFEASPYALLSANDPLANQEAVSLEQLATRPLALLDLPVTDVYMRNYFAIHGLEPSIGFKTKRAEMIRSLVGAGLAYSIFIFHPANRESYDGSPLAYLPIKERLPKSKVVLARAKHYVPTQIVKAFMEQCRTTFQVDDAMGPFLLRPTGP